jgi:hypothetical protein
MTLTGNLTRPPKANNPRQHEIVIVDRGQEVRCPQCNKLAFKGKLGKGTEIEVQCRRCYDENSKHFFFRVRVM